MGQRQVQSLKTITVLKEHLTIALLILTQTATLTGEKAVLNETWARQCGLVELNLLKVSKRASYTDTGQ